MSRDKSLDNVKVKITIFLIYGHVKLHTTDTVLFYYSLEEYHN